MIDEELLGPQMKALTVRRRAFVMAMFKNPFGSRTDWAKAAGYSDASQACKVKAHQAYHNPKVQAAIAEYGRTLIGTEGVVLAIHGLLNIARNGEHPQHSREVEMILNRTGFAEKQQIEVVHRDLTGDALMERIAGLAERYGLDTRKLLGPDASRERKVIENKA